RPAGASPLRVSLVPAFASCESSAADSMHGAPLAFASCSAPKPRSSTTTIGGDSLGFVRMVVCPANSGAAFCNPSGGALPKPDVRLTASIRDVICAQSLPPGQAACSSAGADYDPNGAAGPYADGGGGTSAASPPCFPSATSASDCVAGADLTWTSQLPGSSGGVRV